MRRLTTYVCAGIVFLPAGVTIAAPIDVATTGSFNATYSTASQVSPKIPWSDLGFQANASVTQGALSGAVGGKTQYEITTPLSASQPFTPGVTQISLGYTPGWTGSMSTTGATGNLGIDLAYSFGPIHGSVPLLTDSMTTGVSGLDLAGALNGGTSLSHSSTTSGFGAGGGFGLKAQWGVCPLCTTVASVSFGYHVGTQVEQNLAVAPTVTYGDLVWFSNGTYATAPQTVSGSGGSVTNTFTKPDFAALNLPDTGGSFMMNILPYAALSLAVGNEAIVSIPASIGYSFDVFGVKGSGSAAGDLYSLSTGDSGFTATGLWYGSSAYSIGMTGSCVFDPLATRCQYGTTGDPDPVLITLLNWPSTFQFGDPGAPSGGGGSVGIPQLGPLFPGDTGCVPGKPCNAPCDPNNSQVCVEHVTITRTSVPEPGVEWLLAAGLLALGLSRRKVWNA